MTALNAYMDRIAECLATSPRSSLPADLSAIDYLMACKEVGRAKALAEYLAAQEAALAELTKPVITQEEAEMLQYYIDDPDWDVSQCNDVYELLPRLLAAALRRQGRAKQEEGG